MTESLESYQDYIAAIDLGSNSFHMIVGRLVNNQLSVIDRLREPVRLGDGLMKEDGSISEEAKARAMACFARFGQRLSGFPQDAVRAVGTNTLREAKNATGFIEEAESLLGYPIDIISGVEEARLIHLGVINNIDLDDERHLVIDIGGGSTELIVGENRKPIYLESLSMGCVSYSQEYFNNDINEKNWQKASIAAKLEIYPVNSYFNRLGWKKVVGTSGTIKAIEKISVANGWCKEGITLEAIKKLREALCKANDTKQANLAGLSKEREPVLPGGAVVLEAIFESLSIKQLKVSDHSLREGVLYDLVGRINHTDLRDTTVKSMMERYQCDVPQAQRVASTVNALFDMAQGTCQLKLGKDDRLLHWGAQLHELGLAIAHSQYHKHGAYITEYADMAGFTRTEQKILALLIRNHRRKVAATDFSILPRKAMEKSICMLFILRLAVLLNRSRVDLTLPPMSISLKKNEFKIILVEEWLNSHPLTKADLEQELRYLKTINVTLSIEDEGGRSLI